MDRVTALEKRRKETRQDNVLVEPTRVIVTEKGVDVVLTPRFPIRLSEKQKIRLGDALYRYGTISCNGPWLQTILIHIPRGIAESMKLTPEIAKLYALMLANKKLEEVLSNDRD